MLVACGAPTPATAVGHADSAPEPVIPASGPVIVFLGDSLTAGFGLAAKDALPEQVAKIFKDDGIEVRIINAGVSGDTTANGLARFGWSVAAPDPDLVIVALGANDYLMGIDPEITKQNLSAIVQKAKESDIDCVLVDLQPRSAFDKGSREAVFAAIYPDRKIWTRILSIADDRCPRQARASSDRRAASDRARRENHRHKPGAIP